MSFLQHKYDHEDLKDPKRSSNLKESIKNILSLGAIPIINENDSVSTEEINWRQ